MFNLFAGDKIQRALVIFYAYKEIVVGGSCFSKEKLDSRERNLCSINNKSPERPKLHFQQLKASFDLINEGELAELSQHPPPASALST
jgi:hypothetical protein